MMTRMTSADSTPHLAVIIPTRNNEKNLMDCLRSIMNLDYDLKQIELIIWDNDSEKESKDTVKDFLYRVVDEKTVGTAFIEHHRNLGAFNSRDELFKLVSKDAQYILSIDDDVILPRELLKESLLVFAEDNSVGIIGPRTVYDEAPLETAHGAGFINWWLGRYSTKDAHESLECDYVIGCCMFIKKTVINEIGGFDHDYYTSHGEVDFCLRARKKGYKVVYHPGISIRHRVDRGGTRTLERTYYVYRNKLFVIRKNAPSPQKLISMGLYSLFWLPKAITDSIIRNKRIHYKEIKTIFDAMMDGWSNRGGKRAQAGSEI
jgi:GT2 family glycosyltransferase